MKRLMVLLAIALPVTAQAQSVGELVPLWLAQQGITAAPSDWSTCQPEGQPDGICTWDAKLGAQPTITQLQAALPAWQARRQASQYSAIIAAGVAVTSALAPSLNGTYAADEATQNRLSAIVTGISAGQGLPGGGATFLHPDIAGAPHNFTADQITALAKGTRDFIYNATLVRGALLAGQPASWPSNQIKLP